MRLLRAAAVVSMLAAAAQPVMSGSLKPDFSLLSDGDGVDMPESPFVAHFRKDGMNLYFLAAHHAQSGETLALIREVLRERRVRLVIIEGTEGPRFDDRRDFVREARRNCGDSFCAEGEPLYAAMLAAERGISVLGGEPPLERLGEQARLDGFTREDLLGYAFFRRLPSLQRDAGLDSDGVFDLWERNRFERAAMGGEAGARRFTYRNFLRWYERRNGAPLDLERFDSDEDAPRARGRYYTQRLSASTERPRNRSLLRVLANRLPRDRDVLVVYGSGHFAANRAVLEAMLGRPEFLSHASGVAARE